MTTHAIKGLLLMVAALGVLLVASFSRSMSAGGRLVRPHHPEHRTDEPEVFLSLASLDDVIRARFHAVNALMLVQLATIMALLGRS